jgi:hypothetical protein
MTGASVGEAARVREGTVITRLRAALGHGLSVEPGH